MIVSNTTSISKLLHLDNILLLPKLFGVVYIPKALANPDIFDLIDEILNHI